MTAVSQIITDAYQYNNLVALSVIPSAAEQAKALRYLNRIFRSIFGNELGDELTVWNIGSNNVTQNDFESDYFTLSSPYHIPHNSRIVLNLNSATSIYLPKRPNDGERFAAQDLSGNLSTYPLTINGNGRLIETLTSVVLNTNLTNSEWFFRADKGNWVKLSDLALTDEFPLPTEFEEFFITMLALRLGASEDVDLNNQLTFVLKDVTRKLRSRYAQKTEIGPEFGVTASSVYNNKARYFNSARFNNG